MWIDFLSLFSLPLERGGSALSRDGGSEKLRYASKHSGVQFSLFASSSIIFTSSCGSMPKAFAIFQSVSKLAFLSPLSIIERWLLAMPARPLKISCDSSFSFRKRRMTAPTAFVLNSFTQTPLFILYSRVYKLLYNFMSTIIDKIKVICYNIQKNLRYF